MSLFVDIEKTLGALLLKISFESGDEILGLLGASGCGKSMTLKCIAGIEKPDKGKIILDGETLFDSERKINLPPQKRHVGYLFQNYALFPNMTVRENILCGLHRVKDKTTREKILAETLDLLHITELSNRKPDQLSGGQAQRTALARILVNRPRIMMLDEPFSALDNYLRLKLQMQLHTILKNFGRGVLMVTHDRNEVYRMCDKVAVIDNGRLLTVKGTQEFFADPESVSAAILSGCQNIVKARKIGEYAVDVPEWNMQLTTAARVTDNLSAIGIRSHSFSTHCLQNRHEIEIIRIMEDPFDFIIEFRFTGQPDNSTPIYWRLPKDEKLSEFPKDLGIAEENILLLT